MLVFRNSLFEGEKWYRVVKPIFNSLTSRSLYRAMKENPELRELESVFPIHSVAFETTPTATTVSCHGYEVVPPISSDDILWAMIHGTALSRAEVASVRTVCFINHGSFSYYTPDGKYWYRIDTIYNAVIDSFTLDGEYWFDQAYSCRAVGSLDYNISIFEHSYCLDTLFLNDGWVEWRDCMAVLSTTTDSDFTVGRGYVTLTFGSSTDITYYYSDFAPIQVNNFREMPVTNSDWLSLIHSLVPPVQADRFKLANESPAGVAHAFALFFMALKEVRSSH